VAASDHQQGPKTREDAGALQSPAKGLTADPESRKGARRESGPATETTEEGVISSEVWSRPAPENQEACGCRGTADQSSGQGRRDLREVPLSQLDQAGEEEGMEDGGAARDAYGDDQMCCGFFFKVRLGLSPRLSSRDMNLFLELSLVMYVLDMIIAINQIECCCYKLFEVNLLFVYLL